MCHNRHGVTASQGDDLSGRLSRETRGVATEESRKEGLESGGLTGRRSGHRMVAWGWCGWGRPVRDQGGNLTGGPGDKRQPGFQRHLHKDFGGIRHEGRHPSSVGHCDLCDRGMALLPPPQEEMRPKALDLFCGAGGAAVGLYRAGFDVVGIDNRPQPRYPFPFIQADALKPPVRLEDFDLVWASPPCQGYSRTRHLPWLKDKKRPLLIPPTRKLLCELPLTVIENVEGAPLRVDVKLRGGMFGLPYRLMRWFETTFLVMAPARAAEPVGRPGRMFGHGNDSRLNRQAAKLEVGDGQSIPWQLKGSTLQ